MAIVGRKDRFGFGHLSELAVKSLNGIGSINQPPHLLWILEVGLVVFAGVAVGVTSAALSHLVQKAAVLQEQSDLTI